MELFKSAMFYVCFVVLVFSIVLVKSIDTWASFGGIVGILCGAGSLIGLWRETRLRAAAESGDQSE